MAAFRTAAIVTTMLVAGTATQYDGWSVGADVRLIRQSDLSVRPAPPGVRLSTKRVRVRAGDSLETLLTASGILPDAESFGALYALNPELDPRAPPAGGELVVPAAEGGTTLTVALQEGYLVALTLAVPAKRELLDQVTLLEGLSAGFTRLPTASFPTAAERARSIDDLGATVNFLRSVRTVIRDQTRPLDPELLWQMTMESKRLSSVLTMAVNVRHAVTANDVHAIGLVAENMRLRAERFRRVKGPGEPPERDPRVRVAVRTLGPDRTAMNGLRIYYAVEAFYELPSAAKPFRELSPASEYLLEANYRVWATRANETRPASEVLKVFVRAPVQGRELAVELVIMPK